MEDQVILKIYNYTKRVLVSSTNSSSQLTFTNDQANLIASAIVRAIVLYDKEKSNS